MKIRSLTFLSSKSLQKYRTVADMDVVDFIESINEKIDKDIKINKPLLDLYDSIIANWSQLVQSHGVPSQPPVPQSMLDPIRISLQEVPIGELRFYYPSDTYIIDNLKDGGIDNLGQLYGSKLKDLKKLRNIGVDALSKIESMKEAISHNPNIYIDSWRNRTTIHELPSNYDRSLGLTENLRNAFLEFAEIIEKKLDNVRYIDSPQQKKSYSLLATILKKKYKDGKGDIQIAKEENYTSERIRQIRTDCVVNICSGKVFSGTSETDFLVDLGCDLIDIKDISFIIPTDTKGTYKLVGQVLIRTLVENPLPTDRDVIYELIVNSEDLSEFNYDTTFVKNVLSCDDIVDFMGSNLIQIKNQYLTHSGQRYARIIYEAGTKITTEEAKSRYKDIYSVIPTNGPISGKYGISCEGRKFWYYGEPKVPMQQKVTEFAEERKIFYYHDIEQAILNEGFTITQTFRVYITNVCVVDNKDKNHFCHKDYVDDYPDFNWRNPKKYGWANWIYNEIKSILHNTSAVPLREMIDELEERSHSTDYSGVRQRLQANEMSDFCGEDKPFIIEKGNVAVNMPIYETTDFEIIALRGEKYAYYKQIRSIVANEVKKAESGRMKLTEIIRLVNDTIVDGELLSRNVIIRAIKDEQHRFSPIDVDLINENGILYVLWTKQEIRPEPIYTADSSGDYKGDDHIVEIEPTEIRPNVHYRQVVNLQELNNKLKSELSFSKGWMLYEHYDYENAIASFIDFINHSQNPNLSKRLPQDLYEYWFASTDENDRYRYLTDLLIFFESLMAELYIYRYGSRPHTHGLSELATYFEGLPDLLLYSRDDRGFSRIASNLQYNRNKVAHGVYLEMNSRDTANRIVDYVALFVYVVARYYSDSQ